MNPPKLAGILSLIAALIMLVAGATTWATITTNLASQNITVAKDSPMLAGDFVDGPFSAFAEAQIIEEHALKSSNGKTYADLGAEQSKIKADAKAAGLDLESKDPAVVAANEANPKYAELKTSLDKATAARTSAMNASFLRASLFTSVVAYGVSALVMGLGLMLALLGWALLWLAKRLAPVVGETDGTARTVGTARDGSGATAV